MQLDYSKLLRLIDELNENYARSNAYAAHALLRAILDHIPPILGFKRFDEVANNYPWSITDKGHMSKLLRFKGQADDALHRPISSRRDLIGIDDMPPRLFVNRLLQECDGSNAKPPKANASPASSRVSRDRSTTNASVSRTGRKQTGRLSAFQRKRMPGDISIGDLRNWVSVSILGCIAAVAASFALHTWPKRLVQLNDQEVYRSDPHRYICYAVVAVGVIIAVLSVLEGLGSVRTPTAELRQPILTRVVNPPIHRALRSAREFTSLAAGLLVFSGLVGFENYGVLWPIALAAIGGLALIALVRRIVCRGGDCLLAGTVLLFIGAFVPISLNTGGPTVFGIQKAQGAIIAISAVILGVGWLYLWAPSLLFLLTLLPATMLVLLWAYGQI